MLTLGCVAVNLEFAPYFATFLVALALLGVGWNFMFVGGTTLLTTAYDATERVRVQGLHDFIVFASVACTAVSSGAIHMKAGWDGAEFDAGAAGADRDGGGGLALRWRSGGCGRWRRSELGRMALPRPENPTAG